MNAKWTRPTTIGLSQKLKEVNEKLREVIPLIVEAQVKAVEGMAKTAIEAEKRKQKTITDRKDEQLETV